MYQSLIFAVFFISISVVSGHNDPVGFDFKENKGQWHENVRYRADIGNATLFLENSAMSWLIYDGEQISKFHENPSVNKDHDRLVMDGHTVRVHFEDAEEPRLENEALNTTHYNYFLGSDTTRWISNVPSYSSLRYREMWPGIDLRFYGANKNVKYDFIVEAGTSPKSIVLRYEGADSLYLKDGDLHIKTSVGEIIEKAPYAYQFISGSLNEVECHIMLNDDKISFEFPSGYDHERSLVIDPEIIASTLSGSAGNNWAYTGTYDNEGNILASGISLQANYNVTPGAFQTVAPAEEVGGQGMVISKFNQDGSGLLWATYLSGSGFDYPHSLIVNEANELYILGTTNSLNFPTTDGSFSSNYAGGNTDLFISQLSENGTQLLASTFVGGNDVDGDNDVIETYDATHRSEINFDAQGRIIVATCTRSSNFPVTSNAAQPNISGLTDAVVFCIEPDLSEIAWATYIGGNDLDAAYSLRSSESGLIFVTGTTISPDFPVTAGAYQTIYQGEGLFENSSAGWLAQLSEDGSQWNAVTFFLTPEDDTSLFIDLDEDEAVWITGQTFGETPIIGDVYSESNGSLFLAKFNQQLNELQLATRFGEGWGAFAGANQSAFGIDDCGNVNIAYQNAREEANLPLTDDAFFDEGVFYMTILSKDAEELLFASRYSGSHIHGGTSRFDASGILYQAVCTPETFFTTPNALSSSAVSFDIAVLKIDFQLGSSTAIVEVSEDDAFGCVPHTVAFQNNSTGSIFEWNFGDGSPPSNEAEPVHTFETVGVFNVQLISFDPGGCAIPDTAFVQITVTDAVAADVNFDVETDCESISVSTANLTSGEGLSYLWDMGDSTVLEGFNVEHTYENYGSYTITLTAVNESCTVESSTSEEINISGPPTAAVEEENVLSCSETTINFVNTGEGDSFIWDFGDGSTGSTEASPQHTFPGPGEYTVTLTAENTGDCAGTDVLTIEVVITETPSPEAFFTATQTGDCESLTVALSDASTGQELEYSWDVDGSVYNTPEVVHEFDSPGTYTISMTITDLICDVTSTYTETVDVINSIEFELEPEYYLCYNESALTLIANGNSATSFSWSTGDEGPSTTVSDPGTYSVTAIQNGCSELRDFVVIPVTEQSVSNDITICEGVRTSLAIVNDGGSDFQWCNDGEPATILPDEAGEYCYTFLDSFGCVQEGRVTLDITDRNADVYIPNAFTPNGDGINDVFRVVGEDLLDFSLIIWNRWGEEVFATNDPDAIWNGSFQGNDYFVPNGVYVWRAQYRSECSAEIIERTGSVMVLR